MVSVPLTDTINVLMTDTTNTFFVVVYHHERAGGAAGTHVLLQAGWQKETCSRAVEPAIY
jgi:hypothetical protein